MKYTQHYNTRKTPQSQPIPGSAQVKNSAGGFSFQISDWDRLSRFLILGSEGGSYYANERKLTVQNAECVKRCLAADGPRTVAEIARVSDEGLAPKNDPAIFALAMALKLGNESTRRLASATVPKVCRTGTHLFQLSDAIKAFGGWGRLTTKAFAGWFNDQKADDVAYQAVKYQQREGWSMKDLLVKSHAGAKAPSAAHKAVFSWITHGGDLSARTVVRKEKSAKDAEQKTFEYPAESREALPRIIEGFEAVRKATNAKDVVKLITDYNLPREVLPTEHLNSKEVWEALLYAGKYGMPVTAMIRNLAKMTSIGLIAPMSDASKYVVKRLKDAEAIAKGRVHPMQFLIASRVYAQGHGEKGKLSWKPIAQVTDALENGFYLAFKAVEPTGLNHLLALDISGSMGGGSVAGTNLTPREASVAMALVTANTEENHHMVGFTSGGFLHGSGRSMHAGYPAGLSELPITARSSLRDACEKTARLPMGGTDCALPMLYAKAAKLSVDVFVVYTDNETWAGAVHPVQALKDYREWSGRPAKLIVVGMVGNEFTIADPNDAGMLDVVGFDASAPNVMAAFAASGKKPAETV